MMTDEEYRKVFAAKLKYYMDLNKKNQKDLMRDLNLSSSTVSSWCTGQKLPRMGKIQMLANYFGINKSDLIEEGYFSAAGLLRDATPQAPSNRLVLAASCLPNNIPRKVFRQLYCVTSLAGYEYELTGVNIIVDDGNQKSRPIEPDEYYACVKEIERYAKYVLDMLIAGDDDK